MRLQIRLSWFQPVLLIALSALSSGCIHFAPMPYAGQRDESRALGKIFKTLTPQAQEMVVNEHKVARELRITLAELGKLSQADFTDQFNSYTEELVALQGKRRQLQQALGSRQWDSPMVRAVQQGAIKQLIQDGERNQKWIELADGVRLRVKLGRDKDFPELTMLSHQLDVFLSARNNMDPFADRLQALKEAFGLSEADFE